MTSSRTEFPTESTFRTELALASLPHFLFVGETSQQRQGARRAEETGRSSLLFPGETSQQR
ncbi:hypothetical protein Taro_034769 [Colocasia esculenta]|uniref:Uncharacterized protein n=1 Tax=Colocasia esculenta TaxID=4460 RepID=A0A843W3U9_COLES|nr:hypothetical protein [Colocasia esculenta]